MTLREKIDNLPVNNSLFSSLSDAEKLYSKVVAHIAVKLIEERTKKGYTQKEFAGYMGVSQSMISKWESAEYNFSVEKLVEIFDKLDMELKVEIEPKKKEQIEYIDLFPKIWKNVGSMPSGEILPNAG